MQFNCMHCRCDASNAIDWLVCIAGNGTSISVEVELKPMLYNFIFWICGFELWILGSPILWLVEL